MRKHSVPGPAVPSYSREKYRKTVLKARIDQAMNDFLRKGQRVKRLNLAYVPTASELPLYDTSKP